MSNSSSTPRRERVEHGVYRRRDKRLEIGWRDARGKQRWKVVDGGIKAARAALAQEHAKRARGEYATDNPRLTFNEAADVWLDARVSRLRPGTQRAYGTGLAHLRREFGHRRMSTISPADVAAYVARQDKKGWTIKGHLTVLSAVFKYASRHLGLVGQNPVALLDRVERPRTDDERPKRILTPDELRRLITAVDDVHRPIFRLAAETGCRLAEALGLTWADIDLDNETVAFTSQLDRQGKRVPLKTARSRRVLEVTPTLMHELRSLRPGAPHELVFTTRYGTGHDHRNIGGRVLRAAVKRAKLGAVEVAGEVVHRAPTFHDLRHSHASALIAQGWDIESVSARLGHADVGTTQRVYVHAFDAARRSKDRRAKLAQLYGSAMEASGRSKTKQKAPRARRKPQHLRAVSKAA